MSHPSWDDVDFLGPEMTELTEEEIKEKLGIREVQVDKDGHHYVLPREDEIEIIAFEKSPANTGSVIWDITKEEN